MSDRLTKEQRHKNMSAIHGKNTKPELLVRKFLFSRGFRYRLNHPRLPGHPDLVLRKYRTVIFVNDIKEQKELASMGWHCITVWECQLKPALREQTFKSLEYTLNHIYLEDRIIKSYAILEEEKQLVVESKIDSYHL